MSFMSEPAPGSVMAHASRVSPRNNGHDVALYLLGARELEQLPAAPGRRPCTRGRWSSSPPPPPGRPATTMDRSMPPYSAGMLRLLNPAARAFSRSAPQLLLVDLAALARSPPRTDEAPPLRTGRCGPSTTSLASGIVGRFCAQSTASSPFTFLGKGREMVSSTLSRILPAREPRKLHVLPRHVFTAPSEINPGHLLSQRRSPHHPVPPGGQDVEALHRLVDDRQVVRRVVDGRRPRPRYRQPPSAGCADSQSGRVLSK